ncbi:hypothetical protein EC912_10755 [Luteibacter rhizovicinus]|uniref:Uncharacterized protein n=1 Tax=Luteibacter rhizovicinus TaxID=242606 RepID=A0A4V2W3K3_9GAMM|nr:hypothetical protein [Luteibacter rhizovicinus]TCV92349.1 hypothetical protein EC912_10755 [Luteibacter rhizovicinus]
MDNWELVPGRGIRRGDTTIFFGTQRKALHESLGGKPEGDSLWDDEDEYSLPNGDEWLRLRFMDGKLCDIEVLGGSLHHEGVELIDTTWPELEAALKNTGRQFEATQWLSEGHDCIDLQIVVASRQDIGEDGDGIAWLITSSDFKVE